MKTLEQHNNEVNEAYAKSLGPKRLDIECPIFGCGGELIDDSNGLINLGIPPSILAKCEKCAYRAVVYL